MGGANAGLMCGTAPLRGGFRFYCEKKGPVQRELPAPGLLIVASLAHTFMSSV